MKTYKVDDIIENVDTKDYNGDYTKITEQEEKIL